MEAAENRKSTRATAAAAARQSRCPVHHFTVDVEEHFQVSAFEPYVERSTWESLDSRVDASTERILEWLAEAESTGTFFILGWIAERRPALVRRIAEAGHEVASHGQDHARIPALDWNSCRESLRRSKAVLEQTTGEPVLGFRAPSFSILPGMEWALDLLIEEGYAYDSSLYPVRRRGYGYPQGSPDPWWVERPAGRLLEVPPATLGSGSWRIPAGGGGTFRHLPYPLVRAGLNAAAARGVPGTFYIHPWEVDPDQPRLDVPWATRWRHYGGLRGTGARLQRLIAEFRFRPIRETLREQA